MSAEVSENTCVLKMSMLAGPRIKQKFSSDPRGTAWSNDDSKFGQKLMEKFGWKKGKGLGANEDGNINHVAVALKTDNKGVGCSKSHADNWIAHQDDFNSLLASLNQANDAQDDPDSKKVIGLEAKSKSSRSRVHYQKFTKGKDLSGKSSEDLDCIFGKRKSQSQTSTPQLSDESSSEATEDNSHGVITVRSTDSVQDYFAKKMSEMKKSRGGMDSNHVTTTNSESTEQSEIKEELHDLETNQRIKFSVGESDQEDNISESDAMEHKNTVKRGKSGEYVHTELKKKVRFMLDEERESSADEKKEKKKKRKKDKDIYDNRIDSQNEVVDESLVKKKKSKKKRKENQDVDDVKTECLKENKMEVKKKKRKIEEISVKESRHKEDILSEENEEVCTADVTDIETLKKRKILETSDAEEMAKKVDTNKTRKKKKKKKLEKKKVGTGEIPDLFNGEMQKSLIKRNETKTKKKKVPFVPPAIKSSCSAFRGSNLTEVSGYAYSDKLLHKVLKKQNKPQKQKKYRQKRIYRRE